MKPHPVAFVATFIVLALPLSITVGVSVSMRSMYADIQRQRIERVDRENWQLIAAATGRAMGVRGWTGREPEFDATILRAMRLLKANRIEEAVRVVTTPPPSQRISP